MGRPTGSHNATYDARREALAEAIAAAMLGSDEPPSLRGLATATGVSVPTVRHYFGDLDGAIEAGFTAWLAQGETWLAVTADPGPLGPAESLSMFLRLLAQGWERAVGQIHAVGLSLGLGHGARGPAYLDLLFEPTLQALEARLAVHQSRGELREGDPRVMAIGLLAPSFVALLHQRQLGGAACRPLDEGVFSAQHLDAFLRAWGPADQPAQSA